MDTANVQSELSAFDAEVDRFESNYEQRAEGKAGIQKGMDVMRAWVNRGDDGKGYGDDQWKNIANTQHAIEQIEAGLQNGSIGAQQAEQQLDQLRQSFQGEAQRVDQAQQGNARVGQIVHGAGRVLAVSTAGIAGAGAGAGVGSVPLAIASAAAAGSAYDAVTVGAVEFDKKMGNSQAPANGQPGIAPTFDANQSLGGLGANAFAGQKIEGQDIMQAATGTALDAVSGFGVGQGVNTARLRIAGAHRAAQQVAGNAAARAGTLAVGRAAAGASVKTSLQQSALTLGVQSAGTAIDPSLSREQRLGEMAQTGIATVKQSLAQIVFGAAGSATGAVLQAPKPATDALLQWGVDSSANVAQSVIDNAVDGKGFNVSNEQLLEAALRGPAGALYNVKQRVTPEDAGLANGLNPYFGPALHSVPQHGQALSHVFGQLNNVDPAPHIARVDIPDVRHRETKLIWQGPGRELIDDQLQGTQRAGDGDSAAIYRAFEHPVTKQTRFVKTELTQPDPIDLNYQNALRDLSKEAGLADIPLPVLQLSDETPVDVLSPTLTDSYALNLLRGASLAGKHLPKATFLSEPLMQEFASKAPASEWMHHFTWGSGQVKRMTPAQVNEALPRTTALVDSNDRRDFWSEEAISERGLAPSRALDEQIAAQRARGQTQGLVQGISGDSTFYAQGDWGNAIGGAHAFALYKGKWQDVGDGAVRFEGERHWMVQDRYNWAAKDFNGLEGTAAAVGLPPEVVKLLPPSYQQSFDLRPASGVAFGSPILSDALFAHLQMVQGGAQPFWTVGISDAQPVRSEWVPGSDE
jgi:hypothetical protein